MFSMFPIDGIPFPSMASLSHRWHPFLIDGIPFSSMASLSHRWHPFLISRHPCGAVLDIIGAPSEAQADTHRNHSHALWALQTIHEGAYWYELLHFD
jgi:hypothetical protein